MHIQSCCYPCLPARPPLVVVRVPIHGEAAPIRISRTCYGYGEAGIPDVAMDYHPLRLNYNSTITSIPLANHLCLHRFQSL